MGQAALLDSSIKKHLLALGPRAAALERAFSRALPDRDPAVRRALVALSPAAAAKLVAAGKTPAAFFEQVRYHGRRLAKLNVRTGEVARALALFERALPELPAAARRQLRLATLIGVHAAYSQVREAEADAFYGLFRAELAAVRVEDLLERSAAIVARALRASAGRLLPGPPHPRLRKPRYIRAGAAAEELIDAGLRGRHASYWSVPAGRQGAAGLWQFGFPKPYPWLPRELDLLEAAAERCLAAVERRRLLEEVRRLAASVMHVEEAERRRISRELHDQAGQSLLLLRLELERLERSAPEPWHTRLGAARATAAEVVEEIRRVLAALSPAVLERYGLAGGLRSLAASLRRQGVEVDLRLPARVPLDADLAMVLYRLAQECLQNVARHAAAAHVKLSIRASDRWVELEVVDDGSGFDVERALRKPGSYGLAGMRERVALAGGSVEIRSRPGRGAAIRARLPLRGPGSTREPHVENPHPDHRRPHPVPAGH